MNVTAEQAHCCFALHRLAATHDVHKGARLGRLPVSDLHEDGARCCVPTKPKVLALIILSRLRQAKNRGGHKRETPSALLAGNGRGPQVAPRLLAIYLRVDVAHGLLVTAPHLPQNGLDVMQQPRTQLQVRLAERDARLGGPIPHGEV